MHDLRLQLTEVGGQFDVHLAYHRAEERHAQAQAEADLRSQAARRWYRERIIQIGAAVIGSSAVGALVSQLMHGR